MNAPDGGGAGGNGPPGPTCAPGGSGAGGPPAPGRTKGAPPGVGEPCRSIAVGNEIRTGGRPPGPAPGGGAWNSTVRGGRTNAGAIGAAGIGRPNRSRAGGGGGRTANSRGRGGRKNNGGRGGGAKRGPANM